MSKAIYPVIGGVTRFGGKMYTALGGVTRNIKYGYVVKDGVTRMFFAAHPFVSYTGDYTVENIESDGQAYELYALKTSGVLVLSDNVDCWMCGGGGGGAPMTRINQHSYSGGGAGGGYVNSCTLGSGSHVVSIGAGGVDGTDGGTTSVDSISAHGGYCGSWLNGGNGGSGGGCGGISQEGYGGDGTIGKGAGVSTYPFGIESLLPHCGGGAGGTADYSRPMTDEEKAEFIEKYPDQELPAAIAWSNGHGNGGSNGSDGNIRVGANNSSGTGGYYGGGDSKYYNKCTDATFYGGGGAGLHLKTYFESLPGTSGYQGIVYLLIPAA